MAVRGAVAVVVGANVVDVGVAVGTRGDGAEVVVLRSESGGDAEGEGGRAVAVDAVGAAACVAFDDLTGVGAGVRG